MKKLTALLLAMLMILGTACALADSGSTNIRIGDYVYLGHYEQNGSTADGAESIRWLVIDRNGSDLFLISDKALENLPFNKKSDGTAWAGSYLRQWLNGSFLSSAFTAEEAAAIRTTQVEDTAEHSYSEWNTARRFSGITEDKVFCLSFKEACDLLTIQWACCEPSAVVAKSKSKILTQKADGNVYCYWWLRTSSYKNNAMMIAGDGFSSAYEHHHQICVRPVLWVDASAVTK